MSDVAQFPYVVVKNARGEIALRPLLTVTLAYASTTVETTGLLDTVGERAAAVRSGQFLR